MKMNNGYLEVGGEKVAVGIPVLEIEHTDMSMMSESMAGVGCPNFLLPAIMGTGEHVDLPFEDDGMYRIIAPNSLVPLIGYVWITSAALGGVEAKSLFGLSMGDFMPASAIKQTDGKWLITIPN